MTMQTLDTRKLLALLVLAFVIVLMWGGHQGWNDVGETPAYPTNDCGKNYFLTLHFQCNGEEVEHVRGGATKNLVDEVAESFRSQANTLATAKDYALQYIEQWFFK